MAAELASADYAFLIILKAEGRELSNTEMDRLYQVRLVSPAYEKLNAEGFVSSDTTNRPYRHAITSDGLKLLAGGLSIDEDRVEGREKRTLRERQLWAAVVAQQNEIARLRPKGDRAPAAAGRPAGLDGRIRAAYDGLADGPGEWVDLVALRPLFRDVPRAALDEALVRMLDAPDVRLEPEPFGHRIGAEERDAAVRVGGEDRHKLAIGLR
jgi:hypothetical protein